MVYVISKTGNPLMPTTRHAKVRIMIKQNLAKVIDYKPFTIQLLYDTPEITQPIVLGDDVGRDYISGTAVSKSDGRPLYSGELKTRNREVPDLMKKRKAHRQA